MTDVTYDMNNYKYIEFRITDFNGNLAEGEINTSMTLMIII